jgi:circadian clock protein KaiC
MTEDLSTRLSSGITGLDDVLRGGLIPARTYLLRGGPGTGKTTVGLHFLTLGDARVEKPLFITMGEPEGFCRKFRF